MAETALRRAPRWLLPLAAVLWTAHASAQPPPEAGDEGAAPAAPEAAAAEDSSWWDDYTGYWDRKLEWLSNKPLWGNTTQLPQGFLKIKYTVSHAQANSYYDRDGNRGPLLPPISFSDFGGPGRNLTVSPRITGKGGEGIAEGWGHTFQASYGITDPLDVFVELPFQQVTSGLRLETTLNGEETGPVEYAIFTQLLQANGRPLPNTEFDSPMLLGDVSTGVSWNFFRSDWFSAAVTPKVFLPTGSPVDPNNDLTFLLGPGLDSGVGAFAAAVVTGFDLKPLDWLVLSFEVGSTYRFAYERDSPKFLPITDCKRIEDPGKRAELACPDTSAYDRAYDLEQSSIFPNLEGLDPTYTVMPGLATSFAAGFTLNFPIPVQFGYQFDRTEAPTVKASGRGESGANFERLVRELQLLEASEIHSIALGTQLPLLPAYIPIIISPEGRWVVGGRNTIKLAAQYTLHIEGFIPLGDIWMDPEKNSSESD